MYGKFVNSYYISSNDIEIHESVTWLCKIHGNIFIDLL